MSRWRPPPTSRRCVQSLRSEGPERRRFALRAGGLDNSERPESQSAVGRDACDTTGTPEGGGCSFPSGGSRWVRDLITLVSLSRHVHAHVCGAGGSALSRRAAGCGLKPYVWRGGRAYVCISSYSLSTSLVWCRVGSNGFSNFSAPLRKCRPEATRTRTSTRGPSSLTPLPAAASALRLIPLDRSPEAVQREEEEHRKNHRAGQDLFALLRLVGRTRGAPLRARLLL
mmetsp:Transcript_52808/g.170206  ORF Transcript_52808/g.170206 Transcript_52808/m.170206 type:complete len:227 (+) Transcript_52808:841-1521(+)